MPAKANPKNQRDFFETILHPLMKKAKIGEVSLLFLDASHFVMGCDFLGCIYGSVRRFVRTCSGRKRYNVLGALDFVTKKLLTLTNDTYITSTQICELLKKVAVEYAATPVYIVLDNASYQKCQIVFDMASELGINLVYIPSYSPNLNLIERLWKFVKARLRTKYYDDFYLFKQNIDNLANSTDKENRIFIESLISEKVQLFDDFIPLESNPYVSTIQCAA